MTNKEYMKKYYKEHKNNEHYIETRKKYSKTYIRPQESIEKHKQKTKEWKEKNKQHILEYQREYRKKHRVQILKNDREWRQNNPDKVKKNQQNDYKKRTNDPILKLKRNIRNRINDSFKKHNYKKNKHSEEILGCKIEEFIIHLLKTFKDNYGYEWDKKEPVHIDHIIPLSTANTEADIIKLCHYTNLQLLKAKDNLSKHNSLNWKLNN